MLVDVRYGIAESKLARMEYDEELISAYCDGFAFEIVVFLKKNCRKRAVVWVKLHEDFN